MLDAFDAQEAAGKYGLECSQCHKHKLDVSERIDPYSREINEEEVLMLLCEDCEQERRDDI